MIKYLKVIFFLFIFGVYSISFAFGESKNISDNLGVFQDFGDIITSEENYSFPGETKYGYKMIKNSEILGDTYYEEIIDYKFSDDNIYYIVEKNDESYALIKDEKEIYSSVKEMKYLFTSQKGGNYAIKTRDDFIILNGKEISLEQDNKPSYMNAGFDYLQNFWYEDITGIYKNGKKILNISGLKISKTGKKIGYILRIGSGRYKAVINNIESKEYSNIGQIIFSQDETKYAFIFEGEYINDNGVEYKAYGKLGKDIFYSESNDLFYQYGGGNIYKNNQMIIKAPPSLIFNPGIRNYKISVDGSKVFFEEGMQKNINIDGKYYPEKLENIKLSNEGNNYTLIHNYGKNLVKDGQEIRGYDTYYSPLFLDNGDHVFIGKKKNNQEKEIFELVVNNNVLATFPVNINTIFHEYPGMLVKLSENPEIIPLKIPENFLNFTQDVQTPATVSKDPKVIGTNSIFAFLYILLLYFIGAVFNNFFQKNEWVHGKINTFLKDIWGKIWKYIGIAYFTLFGLFKSSKIGAFFIKLGIFIKKYQHKLSVLLSFILIGIITQVIVGEIDISSFEGIIAIVFFMFSVGIIAFLKDLVLYLLLKKSEKQSLKIEIIPTGFVIMTLVAGIVNYLKIVPGVILGAILRLNVSSRMTERKIENPGKLLGTLLTIYLLGVGFWYSTGLFENNSNWQKMALSNYYVIINDVFFTLLPFSLFWGKKIYEKPRYKAIYFIFLFVILFTLFHTILNPSGDLSKIHNFSDSVITYTKVLGIGFLFTFAFWFFIIKKKIFFNPTTTG